MEKDRKMLIAVILAFSCFLSSIFGTWYGYWGLLMILVVIFFASILQMVIIRSMYRKRDFRLYEIEIILIEIILKEEVSAGKISRTIDGGIRLENLSDGVSRNAWKRVKDYAKVHDIHISFGLTKFTMDRYGICPEGNTNTIDILI